ncbi:hypothetical protein [Sneathiella limimaris]|uniref:hypothetical protein n=1 Tax=Sneathiella limimaris TaxID=1964213 RepID=UPI00146D962C|nr:hypothetical protein [Sneathiella limimaris]
MASKSGRGEIPKYTEITSNLLISVAGLCDDIGKHNPEAAAQMQANSDIYNAVSQQLLEDPEGTFEGVPVIKAACDFLGVAAEFMDDFADHNPAVGEVMHDNANLYRKMQRILENDPWGEAAEDG